ncbi:MAG: 4Fe-4S dicluster domain-containing protein [candidate division WOR-3 bacterium]|nr:4Fe-4S dicluster domain-containing protein [candidate division WOR-3 bacterium]MCX7836862.1 4Fe-4S dicluster domain-containing protein [candidate division WOR-3 bacterium]MDW8114326.1 4Fe-4S dicluster domain-containing protein [candidate division WOR-3 bacterium]
MKKNKIPKDRLKKGPLVIIECPEKIPCNPCIDVCPRKAITIKDFLVEIPKIDYNKCTGCLLCIPKCPGLAIFGVHYNYNKMESLLSLPYEFLPRPKKGEKVWGLDHKGKKICKVIVERVIENPNFDRCAIVQIRVKKKYFDKIRMIKL